MSIEDNVVGDSPQISAVSPRSVHYRYHDFFNVPFGEWWDLRWNTYHEEQILSRSYPTMFYWYSQPPGNIWVYSNMILDVWGRNLSEINMNSKPEFLPLLGTARGGNATLDWYMQYLTTAEMARYPDATSAWADGWIISLNGTTTMDRQAAMAVLNVTAAGFDDFTNWWSAHSSSVESAYSQWMLNEGNRRLDIYNMYEYPFTPLVFDLSAQRVGTNIVLSYDIVSWGMEALMTRWLHEAFMPAEDYFEDFSMHAQIRSGNADVDILTTIAYGIYAYETTVVPEGQTHGDPCWVWEAIHQDYVPSSIGHPKSDFDPYVYSPDPLSHQHNFTYKNAAPGSLWYGKRMPYDYAPTSHNLSANETMVIEFPTGLQLFKQQAYYPNGTPVLDKPNVNDRIVNMTANMTCSYSEPMESDNLQLSPGSFKVDYNVLLLNGPLDLWTWSRDQVAHQFLASEWDRLGILPYGMPYIEFTSTPRAPPHADHYRVTAMSYPVIAGESVRFTVTVCDQYDMYFPAYTGTLHFSSTDSAALLPADYTFTPSDGGTHVFTTVFCSPGLQDLFLVDTLNASITGEVLDIVVNPPRQLDRFELTGMTMLQPDTHYDLTVRAIDQYGRTFDTYAGTVHFSTDAPEGSYSLPADYSFVPADGGVKVFENAMMFSLNGTYEVGVGDLTIPAATGLLAGIRVLSEISIVYTLYDFFEPPFGEWFWNPQWRSAYYAQDYILSNESGRHTNFFDQGQTGTHGIIYAPYRFNMSATNVGAVNVHCPEFMPLVGGAGPQAGARANMHIRMQYLDHAWWWSYWVPEFGGTNPYVPSFLDRINDGYLLGTVYDVRLNREAAYEWLGMPLSGDPATWWAANRYNYADAWTSWIDNEANNRLDILSGYSDFYYPEYTWCNMSVGVSGDILLRISHISWGYEVLMTRWLSDSQLCMHEPYFEDFDLQASFGENASDVTFDAVAQYSFHAVKANGSASNDGAWVWEPQDIDYVPSWFNPPSYHPSDYDPYAGPSWGGTVTYQSWNSGDPMFGEEVEYESTPQLFDLTEFQTLIVKLPQGTDVIGYLGQGAPPDAIFNLYAGNSSDYDALEYAGEASLGYVITNPRNQLDIASAYNTSTKTLTIHGPFNFDNPGGRGGMLYHGAPWIEINVTATAPPPTYHRVVKGAGGPRASAVTWEYAPSAYGNWTGHIVNYGLRSLVVDVYDTTSGVPDQIFHQKIRFAAFDAYPTGTVDTMGVIMAAGHMYSITVTPSGAKGSSCTVEDTFSMPEPPVPSFYILMYNSSTPYFYAYNSYDPDGTIVSYEWSFGDGGIASGVYVNHTYLAPGTYEITLSVTDNDGITASRSEIVNIWDAPPMAAFTYYVNGSTVYVDASGSRDDFGIVDYAWDWGDGATGNGMFAQHTYSVSESTQATAGSASTARARIPPPFMVFGYTYGPDGVIVLPNCSVEVTDTRTGESLIADTYPDYPGLYMVELLTLQQGYEYGDIINVTATNGQYFGSAEGVVGGDMGFIQVDVVLRPSGIIRLITLTVTDSNGVKSSVSHNVPLQPSQQTPSSSIAKTAVTGGVKYTFTPISAETQWSDVRLLLQDQSGNTVSWQPTTTALSGGSAVVWYGGSRALGTLTVSCNVTDLAGNGYVNQGDYFTLTADAPGFSSSVTYTVTVIYEPTSDEICHASFNG